MPAVRVKSTCDPGEVRGLYVYKCEKLADYVCIRGEKFVAYLHAPLGRLGDSIYTDKSIYTFLYIQT